jgi:four helix bundle protein
MFSHEKLQVYSKALSFTSRVAGWTSTWDKKHALVDHLTRAAESVVLNLAEAARQTATATRLRTLDYSIGSSLECAACLDIARLKVLLTQENSLNEKQELCEITRMLVGLRKAWAEPRFQEEPPSISKPNSKSEALFHHENLQVYRTGLSFMDWFVSQPAGKELSDKLLRQIDDVGTSIVLNIAEGNGRYAELDQQHFVQIAQRAAVKAMVYLDLCVTKGVMPEREVMHGKELLGRVSAMLGGF